MYSKMKMFGHPIHPMLIPFPIAFYTATLIAFIVYGINSDPFWFRAGYAANVAGVVMALAAGTIGFLDWSLGIPDGVHAKKDGLTHMILNLSALALFAVTLWLNSGQWDSPQPTMRLAVILPLIGFALTLAAGHYGWKLVQTHHVGVDVGPQEERVEIPRRRVG
jgi:uncharacterized membrane protein